MPTELIFKCIIMIMLYLLLEPKLVSNKSFKNSADMILVLIIAILTDVIVPSDLANTYVILLLGLVILYDITKL